MLTFPVFKKRVSWLAFSPDNAALLACSDGEGMKLLDGLTGAERWAVSDRMEPFWHGLFTADGQRVVVLEGGSRLVVRDAATGAREAKLRSSIGVFTLHDGDRLVAVGSGMDTTAMREMDLEGNVAWTKTLQYMGHIRQLRATPDNRHLVAVNDLHCLLFETATRKLRAKFPRQKARDTHGLDVAPDGRWFVFATGKRLEIVETETAEVSLTIEHDGKPFEEIALTPDGRHLLTVGKSPEVTLWDTQTWQPTRRFAWEVGPLTSVVVSPDGCRAAIGSTTGKVLLWDLTD